MCPKLQEDYLNFMHQRGFDLSCVKYKDGIHNAARNTACSQEGLSAKLQLTGYFKSPPFSLVPTALSISALLFTVTMEQLSLLLRPQSWKQTPLVVLQQMPHLLKSTQERTEISWSQMKYPGEPGPAWADVHSPANQLLWPWDIIVTVWHGCCQRNSE